MTFPKETDLTLGTVPPEFPTGIIELSGRAEPAAFFRQHPELTRYQYLINSDAHSLEKLAANALKQEPSDNLPSLRKSEKPTAKQVIQALQAIMA